MKIVIIKPTLFYFTNHLLLTLTIISCIDGKADHKKIENRHAMIDTSSLHISKDISGTLKGEIQIKENTSTFDINYLMGKFDPETHADFVVIPIKYADRQGMMMRKDAFDSFERMATAASKEGIKIVVRSATRNFEAQKVIWEKKWTGKTRLEDDSQANHISNKKDRALKILKYSSMPGTSRHHWGTDIDINDFTNEYFKTGKGKKLYIWMQEHAHEYGFCQVYNLKGIERPNGYNEERWHWSYMPVSSKLLVLARDSFSNNMIDGFLGSEVAQDVDMVNNYVLSINQKCKNPEK